MLLIRENISLGSRVKTEKSVFFVKKLIFVVAKNGGCIYIVCWLGVISRRNTDN